MHKIDKRMTISALALSLSLVAIAPSAMAQETRPSSEDATTDDIVVTAQKRDQRLLDVPVPVTAVSSDTLVSQNIVSIRDYYSRVPGLQIAGDRSSQISLRGITTGGQTNPTVAILVDDVPFGSSTYLGNATFPDFDPATLDHVEVLRGPQGTLYGASSLGGLIKYVTKTPDAQRFSGRVEIGANSVDHGGEGFSARGSLNIPIIKDRAALSVSGFYRRDPAYIDNLVGGVRTSDVNKRESWGGRASLFLRPIDSLTILLSAVKQRQDTTGSNRVSVASATDFTPVNGVTSSPTFGQPVGDYTNSVSIDSGNSDFQLYSAKAQLDLGFGELTSVSAWGRSRRTDLTDQSSTFSFLGLVYPGFQSALIDDTSTLNKFSQEVRLSGTGSVIDWLVGGFYTKEHANLPQSVLLTSTGRTRDPVYVASGPSSFRELAGFGDVTVHLTPRFDIQVGARYSDNRQVSISTTSIDTPAQLFFGPPDTTRTDAKGHSFTWLVTPTYHITGDVMAYARVAKGYRPGGPNTVFPGVPTSFEPDTVINYELGLKGVTPGKLLTYDVSAFWIDWKNIQLNAIAAAGFSYYLNADSARSRGLEATVGLRPARGLSIDANGTYTDAKLTSNLPASTATTIYPLGADGDRLPFVPKFSANLSVQQDFSISEELNGYVGLTYSYQGERLSGLINPGGRPRISIPSYSNLDLRAGISLTQGWQLNAYVRNVFGEHGIVTASNNSGALRYPTVTFIQPRTVGFTVSGAF